MGAPSSQNDPYAGVRKWNELNSQGFFEKNTNDPPSSRILPTEAKSIPLGPRHTRTRKRQELFQQTHPSGRKHLPNPEKLLSGNHAHRPRAAEKTTSRNSRPGRDSNDEYVGFIIPSDLNTLHSVQEDIRRFQNLGTGRKKVDVAEHNGVTGKGQATVLTCQQPAPKVDRSNSSIGFFPGAAENPTSKNGGRSNGASDKYMGFIIPSDPNTLHSVQEDIRRFQNLGTGRTKVDVTCTEHNGVTGKGQATVLTCQQPAPKVNRSNSNIGFFPGAAENPTSKNGGCGNGASDEYMGFIIPSEPYTFYPVQKSDAKLQTLEKHHQKAQLAEADGKTTAARIAELILSQPAPKVNNSNSKTASWQADRTKGWAPPFANFV